MSSAAIQLTAAISQWPNPNRDRKKHWTRERAEARAIRATAHALGIAAKAKSGGLKSPIEVTMAWAFPDRRERDLENWSSKALLDGCVDSGLIQGDSSRHIIRTVRIEDRGGSEKGQIKVTCTFKEVED